MKNLELRAWSAELELRVEERTAELAQAQVELGLARRLEAIGQLAAGVAHEINTPVQYIGTTLHFLRGAFRELLTLTSVFCELREGAGQGVVTEELIGRVREAEAAADVVYLLERVPPAFERAVDGVERVATIVAAMRQLAHPPGQGDGTGRSG